MTLEQQLKHYITNLFNLPKDDVWDCETVDEMANDILPEQYVRLGPLTNKHFIRIPIIPKYFTKETSILSFSIFKNNS